MFAIDGRTKERPWLVQGRNVLDQRFKIVRRCLYLEVDLSIKKAFGAFSGILRGTSLIKDGGGGLESYVR